MLFLYFTDIDLWWWCIALKQHFNAMQCIAAYDASHCKGHQGRKLLEGAWTTLPIWERSRGNWQVLRCRLVFQLKNFTKKNQTKHIRAFGIYCNGLEAIFFTSAQPPPSLTRFLKLWTFCFKPYNLLLLAFFVFVYWDLKVKLRDLCQILIQGDSHRNMFFDSSLIGYPSRYINPREPLRLWTGNIWVGGATILCLDRRYV